MYRKAKQVNRQKRESTSKNKNKSTIMRKIEQAKKMYKIQDQSDKNRQKEEQVKNMGLG